MTSDIKDSVLSLINRFGIMTHSEILDCYMDQQALLRALSELVMDNAIKRIEYILPDSTVRRAVYFPFGTTID